VKSVERDRLRASAGVEHKEETIERAYSSLVPFMNDFEICSLVLAFLLGFIIMLLLTLLRISLSLGTSFWKSRG